MLTYQSRYLKKGSLISGGSVSTAAYDLAEQMGCNPIILAGQDLAYSDERIHIRGTTGEQIWENTANRITPVSRSMAGFLQRNKTVEITAYGGEGTVWSDRKFLTFLWWFEKRFAAHNEVTVINATEGGARIKGTQEQNLADVIASLPETDTIAALHERQQETVPPPLPEAFPLQVRALRAYVQQVKTLATDAVATASAIRTSSATDHQRLFCKLDRIDADVQSNTTFANLLSSILQKTIHTVREGFDLGEEAEPEASETEHAIMQTIELYSSIREAAEILESYLDTYLAEALL